jgi:hypothetical protein
MLIAAFLMASFSFGYCLSDIFLNYRSEKRLDEILNTIGEDNLK